MFLLFCLCADIPNFGFCEFQQRPHTKSVILPASSRICAVAQYAVLEANAKVNGKSENLHPGPSQTPVPIWTLFGIYYYIQARDSKCAKFEMNQFIHYCSMASAHA